MNIYIYICCVFYFYSIVQCQIELKRLSCFDPECDSFNECECPLICTPVTFSSCSFSEPWGVWMLARLWRNSDSCCVFDLLHREGDRH